MMGSWLPDPRVRTYENDPQRAPRAKALAAMALWTVHGAALSLWGLLVAEANMSPLGAIFASTLAWCGGALLWLIIVALIWTSP